MPGPSGPISILILLRSAQSTRPAGRQIFTQLPTTSFGGFRPPTCNSGFGWEEIDSGGNIETIPPYTSRSCKHWLHGRIITGTHFGTAAASSLPTFLQSQHAQSPIVFLETGFLTIGHVDELV
ncbi:hypothetical protein N0V88_007532 [Collariella sp. IMI 366227]|nr:hypothetical protein N0V88_007532 [Collariella sp. IMI 366227]